MLRTIREQRPAKSRRRTLQTRHGIVGIPAYQLVVSGRRGRRIGFSGSDVSDTHGPARALKKEFSEARSAYLEDGPSTVVRAYGTQESRPELADDNERSTLVTPGYVVGSWPSFPKGHVIPPPDSEEIHFYPRMGVSAVSDFAEDEYTHFYSGMELNQGSGEIVQVVPTSTPGTVSFRQEYGFRVASQMEFGNEPKHYYSRDPLSSASIPSERVGPRDLSLVVEQLAARGWNRYSDRVVTPRLGSCFESPFTVLRPLPCRRRPSP